MKRRRRIAWYRYRDNYSTGSYKYMAFMRVGEKRLGLSKVAAAAAYALAASLLDGLLGMRWNSLGTHRIYMEPRVSWKARETVRYHLKTGNQKHSQLVDLATSPLALKRREEQADDNQKPLLKPDAEHMSVLWADNT